MKRILITSALIIGTASTVNAGTNHGFYAGAGLTNMIGHHNATLVYKEPAFAPQTMNYGFSKSNIGGDIMIGYMAMINNFMLGAELDYLFVDVKKTNTINLDAVTSRTSKAETSGGAWGLALRLGYSCFERLVPYIRLGIENRRFKLFHFSTDAGFPSNLDISSSSRKFAFAPGIGMDLKVNRNFILGLEYRYSYYGSITKTGNNPRVPRTLSFKLAPRVSTALLSLKYVWGA